MCMGGGGGREVLSMESISVPKLLRKVLETFGIIPNNLHLLEDLLPLLSLLDLSNSPCLRSDTHPPSQSQIKVGTCHLILSSEQTKDCPLIRDSLGP